MATGNYTTLCVRAAKTTSSGIWVGDMPLYYSFPLLIVQITLIFIATRITHTLLAPLGQPKAISHVIAGLILGPSLLGRNQDFLALIFPARSWMLLDLLSLLAYVLITFVIGVKTDLRIIRRAGKKALVIGWSSYFSSLILANYVSYSFDGQLIAGMHVIKNLPYLNQWAITFHPVITCLLQEHNLLTSKLGRLAMSTSLALDFQTMIVKAFVNVKMSSMSAVVEFYALCAFLGFLALVLLVARPVVEWMVGKTPEGETMAEGHFVAVILIVLWCGLIGDMIGQNVAVGGLLLGLVLPGGPPLGRTLVERLDRLVSGLLLPVFTAVAGLKVDLGELVNKKGCGYTGLVLAASTVAKQGGAFGAGLWYGLSFVDAFALGLMLNSKGIVELHMLINWKEGEAIDGQAYALSILFLVCSGGTAAALLKLIYNPSSQFAGYNRLSIEQTGRCEELHILACAHDESDASPFICILQSSLPNPTCLYLIHLIPLVGQINTILTPYKKKKKGQGLSIHLSVTDHIVNAFRTLEQNYSGCLSVIPFVAVSPYRTMHNDICQLANDKRIALIILPFHKRAKIKGEVAAKSVKPTAIRALNVNVLMYATCSVAIFIDRGLSKEDSACRSIAVYFLGGVDDREALAYAATMADNDHVSLVLIRLVVEEENDGSGEEVLDDKAVDEFRRMNARNKRVKYMEEEVRDGSDTTEVIRRTSKMHGLLIVGRRDGMRTTHTAGLEMWSEYPELGVIGDLLASTELGGNASSLVVQQQPSRNRLLKGNSRGRLLSRGSGSSLHF